MALTPGTRLGVYEISAPIGKGGMGQVYRATDTALGRQVAIKILPDAFAADPDRLARFQREAKTLASLNHPNIAAIYGLERLRSGATTAIVMELVEGEDLSQLIARGAIPPDEALPIAKQIAQALEAAHEQGIIHRDLKPANIKVRSDGVVKVLDFGLAKALDPPTASGASALTDLPTITSPALMTGVGVLLGTAVYMSPEQAKGKAADRRSDIWAFGCVLYEMLVGRRAFAGDDVSETLAAVLKSAPDWEALPKATPARVRQLLSRCLQKDTRRRLRDIGEAWVALDDAETDPNSTAAVPADARPSGRRLTLVAAASSVALAIGVLAFINVRRNQQGAPSSSSVQFAIDPPDGTSIRTTDESVAVSPDGSRIVLVINRTSASGTATELVVRSVGQLTMTPLPGTRGGRSPFFSPDGRSVAFFADNELRIVPVTGGAVRTIAQTGGVPRGGFWAEDRTIYFSSGYPSNGADLRAVSSMGGDVRSLVASNGEERHLYPVALPGGRTLLITLTRGSQVSEFVRFVESQIAALDLISGAIKPIITNGAIPRYVPSGWLIYSAAGALMAGRFDPDRLSLIGDPIQVLSPLANPFFDVSASGTLATVEGLPGNDPSPSRELVWVDRHGREEPTGSPPRAYAVRRVQVSPDGTRAAIDISGENHDVWVWDFHRRTLTRITTDPAEDWTPVWTPDGREILMGSGPPGNHWLGKARADGTGGFTHLGKSAMDQLPQAVTPDGREVIFRQQQGQTGKGDLWVANLDQSAPPRPLLQTPFVERNASLSPDGKWIAYDSDQTGRFEVYVRPFPDVTKAQWQISNNGGAGPLWARSGKELFYVSSDGKMMSVPMTVSADAGLSAGIPVSLFDASGYYYSSLGPGGTYDVDIDGQRFLMVKAAGQRDGTGSPRVIVTTNWIAELERQRLR